MKNKKPIVLTHDSGFHADDVFAIAALKLFLGGIKLVRSRDKKNIEGADYVVDVGFVYDPDNNKFDHHQEGGAGKRENGIPYASFGLIWKHFGERIAGSIDVQEEIDKRLVQSIDAFDNGITLYKNKIANLHPYLFVDIVNRFNRTNKENKYASDKNFNELTGIAKRILEREILWAKEMMKYKKSIDQVYQKSENKRIVILDEAFPDEAIIKTLNQYKEPIFFVRPVTQNANWKAYSIRDDFKSFKSRKLFPESWAGKTEDKLIKETGVSDAYFCHIGRFIAVAHSREGAIKLAELALKN